jgi:hypothetical protein
MLFDTKRKVQGVVLQLNIDFTFNYYAKLIENPYLDNSMDQ